ncbi:protein kinase domain-containing protein [Acidisoma sp.]|uniref:protein kinase domain-containing protein n=1 Tax=Acidisoma sp. TaxID=1872115 RepID=UPI003B000755
MDQFDGNSAAVTAAGWHLVRAVRLAPGAEAALTSGPADGETLAANPRGLLGAVARTEEEPAEAGGTGNPAVVAMHGLIDGLYNARPTLGRAQALTQALLAINSWMFARHGRDGLGAGPAASLSTIVFSGTRVGLVQIGSGMILRLRAGELSRLTEPQLRRMPGGSLGARRTLGSDSRLLLDYLEEPVLAGDRYILLSDIRRRSAPGSMEETVLDERALAAVCAQAQPAAALAGALSVFPATGPAAPPERAALVIDVIGLPAPTAGSAETSLADLPLAPVPQEGENRDGYLIGRTLHRGAYTLLKYATDSRTREQVVLKFPLPAMLNDRVFRAGFARETWIGHTIRSPVIARIIEPEPGRRSSLYIVMPHYRGETLEARIAREPRFSVGEIAAIALPLCQAVEDLRAVEVLHRDLKPENVMLTTGGGLRLLDLGLAYLAGVEDAGDQGLAGTIRYMAPELLRGRMPDDRTEVYALGVILYRLAVLGRFPRPGADVAGALRQARPDIPPALAATIAAAVDQDPGKRPMHAELLAEAVSGALQNGAGNRVSPRRFASPLVVWRSLALALGLALLMALALR